VFPTPSWVQALSVDDWKHWTAKDTETETLAVTEAKDMMLSNNSRIRLIGMGAAVYTVCPSIVFLRMDYVADHAMNTGPLGA